MSEDNSNKIVKTRAKRVTKSVSNQRIVEVAEMLLNAKTRTEIIEYCGQKYGLQPTSVAEVVTQAYNYISTTHQFDRDSTITLHLSHYYELYAQAKALYDIKGAVSCLNSIEKLMKLTQPDALVQQNHLSLNLKDMTLSDLKDLLRIE